MNQAREPLPSSLEASRGRTLGLSSARRGSRLKTNGREVNKMEIDLWDETERKSRPIARLGLNEDNELEIIDGRGKVRIGKVSIGSEFESVSKDNYQVSITNLSMPIDLDSDSVIEEIE